MTEGDRMTLRQFCELLEVPRSRRDLWHRVNQLRVFETTAIKRRALVIQRERGRGKHWALAAAASEVGLSYDTLRNRFRAADRDRLRMVEDLAKK